MNKTLGTVPEHMSLQEVYVLYIIIYIVIEYELDQTVQPQEITLH